MQVQDLKEKSVLTYGFETRKALSNYSKATQILANKFQIYIEDTMPTSDLKSAAVGTHHWAFEIKNKREHE